MNLSVVKVYCHKRYKTKASLFYFIKLIISRAECKAYHYLDRDDFLEIWFQELGNKSELEDLFNGMDFKNEWLAGDRSHILELLQPACKSVVENLGFYIDDHYQKSYFIHTILTSLFMDWDEQLEFFKKMVQDSKRNIKFWKGKKFK